MKRNNHIGSSFGEFLKEESVLKETRVDAKEGIRQGLDDVAHGRIRPAREFFKEFEAKNGIL